ncbi:hypothetical protein PMIT1318_02168 [Prochlorococcus marinus str. MIT 1318]|uniref:hypothetical protein n=2 Tax=Prochlorococcus TaxID=1218 RepID=UPI0007B37692|nr:hypothetical protein PMIT1318_02168 [Prochlorococcus marinus str. MIT 1318]
MLSYDVSHGDAEKYSCEDQGMSLLQVVFALAVFVIFGAVFLAVSEQLNLYFIPDSSLARSEKEEAPVPILLAERLSTAMDRLVSVLEQPGADTALFPLGIANCSSNPLQKVAPALAGIFSLDNLAANESEFQLASRYEFCLFDSGETGANNQRVYVLVAKPLDQYKTVAMLPIVRRIFCRPKPFCVPTT